MPLKGLTAHILSKLSCCVCPTKHVKDFVNLICMIHALPLKCWFLSRLWPSLWQCQMWSISSHFSFQSTLLGIWTWFYQSQVIVKSCRQGLSYHDNASTAFHYITQLKKLGIVDIYYLDNFHLMVLESSNNAEGSVVTKQRCSWNWYDWLLKAIQPCVPEIFMGYNYISTHLISSFVFHLFPLPC